MWYAFLDKGYDDNFGYCFIHLMNNPLAGPDDDFYLSHTTGEFEATVCTGEREIRLPFQGKISKLFDDLNTGRKKGIVKVPIMDEILADSEAVRS